MNKKWGFQLQIKNQWLNTREMNMITVDLVCLIRTSTILSGRMVDEWFGVVKMKFSRDFNRDI